MSVKQEILEFLKLKLLNSHLVNSIEVHSNLASINHTKSEPYRFFGVKLTLKNIT